MSDNLSLNSNLLLLQPVNGWSAAALDKFSSLVLCRRLKGEVIESEAEAAYYVVNLFAR